MYNSQAFFSSLFSFLHPINQMEVKRFIIFTISLSSFFFPAILHDLCAENNHCPNGPEVRFPFMLLNLHPEYCGHNLSYNLHCDEFNRTILEISPFSKLVVSHISYSSKRLTVEPFEECFAKQLSHLDIDATPFRYYFKKPNEYTRLGQYSLFNCSSSGVSTSDFDPMRCLRSDGFSVTTMAKNDSLRIFSGRLKSCKKMYDTNLIPVSMTEYDPAMFGVFDFHESMELSWSAPNCPKCGTCEWENRSANQTGCSKKNKGNSGVWKKLRIPGPIIACFLVLPAITSLFLIFSKLEQHKKHQVRIKKLLEDYEAKKPTRYSYSDIKKITSDFKYKLGEGGYGNVFKGKITDKLFVAVKVLHSSEGNGDEFINEMGTMGKIHHVNVVRLLGFCADGYKRALVFEFLPNGSLDKFIFLNGQENHSLGMEKLHKIAIAIARGIEYLHQGCEQRILHLDIKPHNILLDENYIPKISDFGLAKLCAKGKSAVSMTAARGTMGYIAPEVFSRQFGNVTYKSDIYSFGMLLLEMVGRRKNIDATVKNNSQVYFPEWIYERLVDGEEMRIQIEEDEDHEIAKRLAIVGLWCIQWNPVDRPSISTVLQMLEGNCDNLNLPSNPFTSSNAVKSVDDEGGPKNEITPVLGVISEVE